MANTKRAYRWFLFLLAVVSFFWVVFYDRSATAIFAFFISGGLWYWLERRKTRELDSPKPR